MIQISSEAREISYLKVEIQALKELLTSYTKTINIPQPEHTTGTNTETVKLFTDAHIEAKKVEIMNRDSTKRMFVGMGRDSPTSQAELSELYDQIDNNGPRKEDCQATIDYWYEVAKGE